MTMPLLTLAQARQRLQVSYSTMRRLILIGQVRAAKIGHDWRVDGRDLEVFIEQQKTDAAVAEPVEAAVRRAFDADNQFRHVPKVFS